MNTNSTKSSMRLLKAQLNELSMRERNSILLAGIAVLTVAWVHRDFVQTSNLIGWVGYMIAVMLVRLKIANTDFVYGEDGSDPVRWRSARVLVCAFYGAGWGMMMFLLDTGQLDFYFMFKFATIAAVLALTMNVMSVLLPVYIGFVAPLILLLTAFTLSDKPYLKGQGASTLFLGEFVYTLLLLAAAQSMAKFNRIGFEHGFERDAALQEALESQHRESVMRERLAVLAQHDDLTGAFNRRHLVHELENHVQTLVRHNTGFSIILIDLDHFKDVNDTFGHPVGDLVLIGFTNFVTDSLREIDIFGRWGGEEFLCILPNTLHEEAKVCAERLRHGLENTRLVSNHPELVVTASFGLVVCQEPQDIEDVMVRVDAALYEAKSGGRNRVIMANNS